jgi:hypothetical protein
VHSQFEKLALFTDGNLDLVARRQIHSGGDLEALHCEASPLASSIPRALKRFS